MKLFATRKKRTESSGHKKVNANPERTNFASDPVVEELLKKDPSEWNAKERRMIKRHEKRSATTTGEKSASKSSDDPVPQRSPQRSDKQEHEEDDQQVSETMKIDDDEKKEAPLEKPSKVDTQTEESTTTNSQGELLVLLNTLNSKTKRTLTRKLERGGESVREEVRKEAEAASTSNSSEEELSLLLDKLNSKTKRTLTRKLERGGKSVRDEVRKEAEKALGLGAKDDSTGTPKSPTSGVDGKNPGGKKKKRKREIDLSTLSAEERLRREEQRRLQKEAADRRTRGEDKAPGFKHPLNSERRRANRRKPKHKGSGRFGAKVDHNASGYLHRRNPDPVC